MKLIASPLEINEDDDYSKGVINREEFGTFLTKIVSANKEPLVIAIDGKWGQGKTTFVKMWQNQLEARGKWDTQSAAGIPSLYIDAFKMEALGDVFVSLVAEIDSFQKERASTPDKLKSNFLKCATELATKMLPVVGKVGIRALSCNLIQGTEIDLAIEYKSQISNAVSENTAQLIGDQLKSHFESKTAMEEFGKELRNLPSEIKGNESGQMIVIVDELDRCSPAFAVEFLEKIKHFFSVENVKFVLVINKQQLEESIKAVYGQGVNAAEYLQKFIDVEASLPRPVAESEHACPSDLQKFCESLIDRHDLDKSELTMTFFSFIVKFAIHSDISLRDIEKAFSNFVLLRMINPRLQKFDNRLRGNTYPAIAYACLVKSIDPTHFRQLAANSLNESDIRAFISGRLKYGSQDRGFGVFIEFIACFGMTDDEFASYSDTDIINAVMNTCYSDDNRRRSLFPMICNLLSGFEVRL